ncbi:MAG: hypothetical protein ACW98A_13820 [Candidatus Hodarchaeales archaeon]|jgi:hypothetical protein
MKISNQSVSEIEILESQMIQSIIDGYFECRSFFQTNKDNSDGNQQRLKKELESRLSKEFFEKFHTHSFIMDDDYGKENVEKWKQVIVKIRSGAFLYPYSFIQYMDRLQDVNLIPIREVNLSELDQYMKKFSVLTNLSDFLLGFFQIVKSFVIPLRERDLEMLQILTNPSFLLQDDQGSERIHPPEIEEISKALGYTKKQYFRILRANKFLYNYRICITNHILMNSSKFGFYFAQIEYDDNFKDEIEKIKPYIYWEFSIKGRKTAIVSVPFGNVNDLLNPFDFTQMTNWYWGFNFNSYSHNKHDLENGWSNLEVPDILAKNYRTSGFTKWDLTDSYKEEFSENELEILKNLTKGPVSFRSLDLLSENLSSGGTRHILQQFVKNGVYQLYPNVNHVDLKDIIVLKAYCQNKDYYQSLLHSLLSFPISHVFTNSLENLLFGYFHIPGKLVSKFVDNINLLQFLLKDKIKIEYELLPFEKKIGRFINLKNIDFSVRNGVAYLN